MILRDNQHSINRPINHPINHPGTHDSTKSIPEMMTSQGKYFKKSKTGIRRLFMPIRRSQSTGNGNDGVDGIDKLGTQV